MNEIIVKKIKEILDTIIKNKNLTNNNIGLLGGKSGEVMFYLYYADFFNDSTYYEKGLSLLEKIFDEISDGYSYPTFCVGIAGVGWAVEHLAQNNFIETNTNETLGNIDTYLASKMLYDLEKNNNYDFLHGAIGIGIYFLNHLSNTKSKKYLIQLIDKLERQSIEEKDGALKWESVVQDINEQPKKVFNLSLSHGIASIVAFLAKAYTYGVYKEKVKPMLENAVKYILKQKLNPNIYGSYFPSWICNDEPVSKSRLAWCYGDLGIAVTIYQAGKALNNKEWEQIAIEVLLHASNRRDLEKEFVVDACLCHGTASMSHIFNRMYRNTGIEKFKETSKFWLNETLKMAKFEDGLAGYKTWFGEKHGGWKKEYGILEGIAGTGLVLISAISDKESKWDECLLLS